MTKKRRQKNSATKASRRKGGLRKITAVSVLLVATAVASFFWFGNFDGQTQNAFASVTVYKSPTCGCCAEWVDHLEDNGFAVTVANRRDIDSKKRELGVPERLYSCHTARVNGYVIEGHVPAADIKELLENGPDVVGLAVPGMPHGSPGMETGRVDKYDVLAFNEYSSTRVFRRY